jgi:hypothetical protein
LPSIRTPNLPVSPGYGRTGIPAYLVARPVVQKPFRIEALAAALAIALNTAGPL